MTFTYLPLVKLHLKACILAQQFIFQATLDLLSPAWTQFSAFDQYINLTEEPLKQKEHW